MTNKNKHPLSINTQAALFQWLSIEKERNDSKNNKNEQWENLQLENYFQPKAIEIANRILLSKTNTPQIFTQLTCDLLELTPQNLEDTNSKINNILQSTQQQSLNKTSTTIKLLEIKICPQTQNLIVTFLIRDVIVISSISRAST